MKKAFVCRTLAGALLLAAAPVAAQDVEVEAGPPADPGIPADSVLAGDFLTLGAGAAYTPSYQGSDDYVISVLPAIVGSVGGIDVNPRAGGVTVDFIEDPRSGIGFDLGVAARIRADRTSQIEDEVVIQYGELDTAIEVGPSVGVNYRGLLNPFDNISASLDVMFDVAGAHEGTVVTPSVSYTTPLSRAVLASLTVNAEWTDENYRDYYFTVDPLNFIGPQPDALPAFQASGSGFKSIGAATFVAIDLDGDVTNGGLGVVLLGGYSRLLGDAADTPFTSIRGSRDQFLGAIGLTYTFGL
ncbi:MipA/OmpV family protein [Aurantiacibacter sediminis]|uniref:MipA/OmpV family protein n=1 Tax=Aurantiacibacter sediminis TaxID=2793064 RepID=A0ABS0N4E2_9SPHN|nr:MipA/OmpV family protein [Aurantiacibacter sediminis]MBH5321854.1 MipA/OmpV family protein [Aurantiacibacter sediminis]